MTVPQLAAKLGIPRQNVHNWIYRAGVPSFEIILGVLARLDIPLQTLYTAYARAGITVPRWDENSPPLAPLAEQPPINYGKHRPTTIPIEAITDDTEDTEDTDDTKGAGGNQPPKPSAQPTTQPPAQQASRIVAPKPLPYTPPSEPYDRESLMAADEKKLIAQTREALREVGASDELIAQAIAHIQAQRQQTPTSREQHILAEHSEPSTEPSAGSAGSASATSASESEIASTPDSSAQRTTQRPTQRSSRR